MRDRPAHGFCAPQGLQVLVDSMPTATGKIRKAELIKGLTRV